METNFEWLDILLVAPIFALFLGSIIPLTIKVLRGNEEPNPFASVIYGLVGCVAASGIAVANYGVNKQAFSRALIFDGLSTWITLIVLLITAWCLLYAKENFATLTKQFSEFIFLIMNSAIGMLVVVWSNDLIVTFVGIELMSLCLYLLIAISGETRLSKEAAFKYFVLGSFASAIFLYGIAFIYGSVGSTYLPDITEVAVNLMTTNRIFVFGIVMALIGVCFKVAIFPFHSWAPDVYQGSPTPVTAFMATGVKAVTFAFFLRLILTDALLSERSQTLVNVLEWLAVLTILVGNIAAVLQTNLKRMLAYSSVAHSGYAMIALVGAGIGGVGQVGASGLVFYLFAYSLMTVGAFGILSLLENNEDSAVYVEDLRGLANRHPMIALFFTIFMLSLAGIPPTIGFFAKFFIFTAAVQQGLYWLALWGVIGSVIGVYYYLRPVVYMYMGDEVGQVIDHGKQLTKAAVAVSAALTIVLGLTSQPIYDFVRSTVQSLF
jgi:NADH-quinone oxidoreductase subunit N